MIDIASETVVSFSDACRYLPRRRQGRKIHASTLWRWGTRGLRGVRLELLKVGGQTCTSVEALQRFFDGLAASNDETRCDYKAKNHTSVEKELADFGI